MGGRATKRGANACAVYNQKPTGHCLQPGPVGRNPYLNFLREFRKLNCGLTPVETIQRGAKAWNCLPEEKKLQFRKEAFYAPKSSRRSRSEAMMTASRTKAVKRSKSSGRVRKSKSRVTRKSSISSMSRSAKRSMSRSRR